MPPNRPLLGIRWKEKIFIDCVLPFELRSAPKIFNALADTLLWVMYYRGVRFGIHYLDDFLFAGPPGSTKCSIALSIALEICRWLKGTCSGYKKLLAHKPVSHFLVSRSILYKENCLSCAISYYTSEPL